MADLQTDAGTNPLGFPLVPHHFYSQDDTFTFQKREGKRYTEVTGRFLAEPDKLTIVLIPPQMLGRWVIVSLAALVSALCWYYCYSIGELLSLKSIAGAVGSFPVTWVAVNILNVWNQAQHEWGEEAVRTVIATREPQGKPAPLNFLQSSPPVEAQDDWAQ